jgi:hypothetical protein
MYAFPRYEMGYPTNGSSAASLSSSQRSSLIPNVFRRFSAYNPSTNAQEYAAADRISVSSATLQSSENQRLGENTISRVPSTRSSPSVCFTCNVVLSSQSALARHCKEICEPEVTRICPVCHWTGERLMRHYANTHSGRCSTGRCSKRTERVCDECKLQLSTSFVTNEAEKAWGCPYCVSCFHTRDLWTRHCYDHYHQNGNVASWSYQTMIWSLLQHPDLETDRLQYNWDGCNWSEITEKTRPGLRDALQRHQVPTDFRLHANYRHLQGPGMLVEYTYQYVMTGQPYFRFMHGALQPGTRSYAQGIANSQLMSEPPFETALPHSDAKQLPQEPTLLHEIAPDSQSNFRDMSMTLPVTYKDEYGSGHTNFAHNFETIATPYTQPATSYCGASFQPDSAATRPNFSAEHAHSSCANQIPAEHVKPPYWSFRLLRETFVHPTEQQPIPPYFANGEQLGSFYHLSINEYPFSAQNDCADRMPSLSEKPLAILPVDSYERAVPQPDADISVVEQSPDEWQTCTRAVTSSDLRPMSDVVEEWIWPMS